MKRRVVTCILAVVWLNGCVFGPGRKDAAEFLSPEGSLVSVQGAPDHPFSNRASIVTGELIGVSAAGLVLIAPIRRDEDRSQQDRLVIVPYSLIGRVWILGQGSSGNPIEVGGRTPGAQKTKRLSRLSRYPYGLSEEAKARLLARFGQETFHELRVPGP